MDQALIDLVEQDFTAMFKMVKLIDQENGVGDNMTKWEQMDIAAKLLRLVVVDLSTQPFWQG